MKRNYSLFPINIDKHEWVGDFCLTPMFSFSLILYCSSGTNVVVLLLCFPTLIVPVLTIAKIKFTSSVWLIDNFGTVVRRTARPGTRETPGSLKAWKKRNWNRTFIIQIKFNIKYNAKQITKYIISIVLFLKINQSNISNRNFLL